ncbi:hypothetical protein HHL28_09350 [Aerophototrophica crusticola]|uniref:Peptidase metallopeptidase domain-containing protein n=1 Tax=Aerophototrophica crusticola TaxID=1709002 RepID=A0A858R796_9PROT|nr:hypothetical protein HHL28_09350 [Rhodospirillaceae bacterium B3]
MVANHIDALLGPDMTQWNKGSVGVATNLTYTFLQKLPTYYSRLVREKDGFKPYTDAQEAAMKKILAAYSSVAKVSFTEKTQSGTAEGDVGKLAFGNAYNSGMSGWGYPPSSTVGGDVWISTAKTGWDNPVAGQKPYWVMMHELGHALGLKHPGPYDVAGGKEDGPFLPSSTDNQQYTVMAYDMHPTMGSVRPQTLQLYDIAALQHLYGANMSYKTGNDVYKLAGLKDYVATFWDAGGTDTFDATGETRSATINLNEGAFSSVGAKGSTAAVNNIAVAFGAKIENANGGNAGDKLVGNALNNVLRGNGGDDTITGGAGNDTIDGGTGTDTATYKGNLSGFKFAMDGGTLVMTSTLDGTDRVVNVEKFVFSDTTKSWADLVARAGGATAAPPPPPSTSPDPGTVAGKTVQGTSGSDKLYGSNGADKFIGGAGNDLLYSAKDGVADTFVFAKGSGADRIFNFEAGIDKLDLRGYGVDSLSDSGIKVSQGSSGAVLDMGDGNRVVLNGVKTVDLVGSKMFVSADGLEYIGA